MDLLRLVFILVTLIKYAHGRERLKWFAYCHFLKVENSIEMLSCGKCLYQEQLKFYLNYDSNQRSIFKNQLNSKYCSFYYNRLNKHQHTLNKDEEELSLLPNLGPDWFTGDLTYLIQKNEISTNLDDYNILNHLPTSLKIIELIDLGIETISSNAFKHFTNLRVLNLAFNCLNSIDFSLFNGSKSSLIELDLSYNRISTLKRQESNLTNLRLLNVSNNNLARFDMSQISSRVQILDLSFNYLKQLTNLTSNASNLNNLIYLNLNNNYFSTLSDLFAYNNSNNQTYLFSECDANRIDVYLNSNKWKCECDSFEYLLKLEQTKDLNCLNSKFRLILDNQINCVIDDLVTLNWFSWFNTTCTNYSSEYSKYFTKPTDTIVSTQQFYFFWNTPTTLIARPQNLTTKILKYDMSTAFYWISSFCVAIITISCLFIVWFYCFKRFKLTRHGLIPERFNHHYHHHNRNNRNRHNLGNNRQDLSRFVLRDQSTNAAYPMAIYRHFRQGRSDASDLYFISLPRRNSNRNLSSSARNQPNITNYAQHHDNLGYFPNEDEPPSYYDAILIKNNRLSICKDMNSLDLTTNARPTTLNAFRTNSTNNAINITNSANTTDSNQQSDLVLNPSHLSNAPNSSLAISTPILALAHRDSIDATILLDRLESELSDDSNETIRQNQLN